MTKAHLRRIETFLGDRALAAAVAALGKVKGSSVTLARRALTDAQVLEMLDRQSRGAPHWRVSTDEVVVKRNGRVVLRLCAFENGWRPE